MPLELGGKVVPKVCEEQLIKIRDRVKELEKVYGSLSRWGRPYIFDIKEVACIYYLNGKLGISIDHIAKFVGVDKTAMYKLVNRIENEGKVTIFSEAEKATKVLMVKPSELIDLIEAELQPRAKIHIEDPLQSNIVRRFLTEKIPKRSKIAGKPAYLSEHHKKETLRVILKVMEWMKQHGKPSNPDLWTEPDVEEALWDIYKEYPRVAEAMINLRRVPEWSQWFKGKIGAVVKRVNPKMTALYYEDYIRLKALWKQGELSDGEFLVIWLHITTGAREGYTLYPENADLDDPNVKSSLVGLKWEKLSKVGDTYIIEIYESKTEKIWHADLTWLDREPLEVLLKYAKPSGSIIKAITGCKTVGEFEKWYSSLCRKVSKLLGLSYKLSPHDMRRSHISILAELGVPMEYALSGHMDLGVGWEDARTALVFYLRFSKLSKELLKARMDEVKKVIESRIQS